MEYIYGQSFNNGKASNYETVDTDAVTMQAIVDLAPKGQTVFNPTPTGAVGTARPMPTIYREGLVVGTDTVGKRHNSTFMSIKYGKSTLTDNDILLACNGKLEVPNGTSADVVRVKKLKTIGE